MKVQARIPVEPFGAARHRARAMEYRPGKWRALIYEDGKYRRWRKTAQPWFERAAPDDPLEGPLQVSLVVVLPFRKSDHRKTKYVPRKWHTARPDLDNVLKAVLDCCQSAAWFRNDTQIARAVVEKLYASQGEEPSLSVTVRVLDPYLER